MLTIYAVSDSIGETAEQVAQAAASQFDDEIEVKRVPYIKTLEDVEELIGDFYLPINWFYYFNKLVGKIRK